MYVCVCGGGGWVDSGYSLSPDLANAATVSVSLIEGNMKEGSQIQGKMVLKRQDLEMLLTITIFLVFHDNQT